MTTNITILVQRLKVAAKNGCCHTLFPDDCLALVEALERSQQRIDELESRTVTFKLPVTPEPSAYSPWVAKAFYQFHRNTVKSCFAVFSDACAAAGIKVEAE